LRGEEDAELRSPVGPVVGVQGDEIPGLVVPGQVADVPERGFGGFGIAVVQQTGEEGAAGVRTPHHPVGRGKLRRLDHGILHAGGHTTCLQVELRFHLLPSGDDSVWKNLDRVDLVEHTQDGDVRGMLDAIDIRGMDVDD